jgi:hypothetical protein
LNLVNSDDRVHGARVVSQVQGDYAAEITLKQQRARTLGLVLIVIGPTDMHRLAQVVGREPGNNRSA